MIFGMGDVHSSSNSSSSSAKKNRKVINLLFSSSFYIKLRICLFGVSVK
jgi:hypothetical protein